jgi:HD-like signal output (HDOD) protein
MASILKGQHASTQEVLEAEREALHVDHARAGSWLVDHWCLPQDFSEICEHHHDAANETDSEILQLVKAACRMADAIGFPAVKCQRQPSFEDAVSLLEPRRAGKAAPSEDDLRAIVTARLAAFER